MAPYQGIARGGGHLSIDRGRGYCWLFRPKVRNAVLSTENSKSIEEIKMNITKQFPTLDWPISLTISKMEVWKLEDIPNWIDTLEISDDVHHDFRHAMEAVLYFRCGEIQYCCYIKVYRTKYLQAAHNKIVSGKGCGDRAL